MFRTDQATDNAGWSRGRLLATLAVGLMAALLLVAGLGLALYYGLHGTDTQQTAEPGNSRQTTAAPGSGYRDRVAAAPMLQVAPADARSGVPAATPGPVIDVPPATTVGPAQVPTGFPQTPEGAVGQLAAIETTVLQGMSIAQTNQVHQQWALPGAVGVAEWPLTTNVQSFLSAAGQNQAKDPTVAVTATPVAGQVKATDDSDWALACVLLDIRATITTEARIAYGYCERMQWQPGADDGGRWMVAPGAPAAPAPSTWPGTDIAFEAGWRTWTASDETE
jgi:hypothetical protein